MYRLFRLNRNVPLVLVLGWQCAGCAASVEDDEYPDPCKWSVACAETRGMAPSAVAGTSATDAPAISATGGTGAESVSGGTGAVSPPQATPPAQATGGTGMDGAGTGGTGGSGGTGGATPSDVDAGSNPETPTVDAGTNPDPDPPPPVDAAAPEPEPEPEPEPALPDYTLVVDTPKSGETVRGQVKVRGRATAFLNVEVWDATHQHPPLAQVVPDPADGSFELTVDTSALPTGATTWTVHAWDSSPGQSFDHTKNTGLDLQISR